MTTSRSAAHSPVQSTPIDPMTALIRAAVAAELAPIVDQIAEMLSARPMEGLVGTSEICQLLAVTPPTVKRMREDGCPYVRVGETYRYRSSSVIEWLAERTRGTR